jgi:D-3-phosphoglycerate dehydrogenase / 2-oxoglutarate reductase
MRILNTIGEAFAEDGKQILTAAGTVDYHLPSQSELAEIIGEYDAALVGLGLSFDCGVLERSGRLRAIATATTGLDHIDVDFARQRNITVLSLRGENEFLNTITGTAELALGLMIDLVRRLPWAFESVKEYQWNREDFKGISLFGKTLGIVGLGRLGTMMARYGHALGMRVIFHDPSQAAVSDYEKVEFSELLAQSDVISIHVHLKPDTENMFNAAALGRMKPGAFLVNTARGKIVDEAAVLAALKSGRLAGYATDVLADELSFGDENFNRHALVEYAKAHQNLIIVPHIGGMTTDSRIATDVFIAKKLAAFLAQAG